MNTIPVQYAKPGRQIVAILLFTFALIAGLVGLALMQSSVLGFGLGLPLVAGGIWLLIRNVNGRGNAILTESSLEITPSKQSWCAGRGPVHIAWTDCRELQTGWNGNVNPPRPYVLIKTNAPRRSWIISPLAQEHFDLAERIRQQANVVRVSAEAEPLQVIDAMSSIGWKIAVVAGLVIACLCMLGMAISGRSQISLWGSAVTLAGFSLSMWPQVFRRRH